MSLKLNRLLVKETPIERIFRKIVHRKMTETERGYFHLKPVFRAVGK